MPARTHAMLMQHYERTGEFAKAEDALFAMLDAEPDNNAIVEFVRKRHVRHVILAAMWGSHVAEGQTARIRRGLLDTINALKNTGTKLWIMRQVPQHGDHPWNIPRALAAVVARGRDPNELGLPLADHLKAFRRQDHVFGRISAPDVAILDPTPFFVSSNNFCRVAAEGKALYFDESHLTIAGAMMLRPLFEPLFEGLDKNSKLSKPSGSGSH